MKKIENPKVLLISAALVVASLIWTVKMWQSNGTLERTLNDLMLKSESLLSEKLMLEKDILKFKDQVSGLAEKNAKTDKLLTVTSAKLDARESEFNRTKKENASLQQLKGQNRELATLNKSLTGQIDLLNSNLTESYHENQTLTTTVTTLQERNKLLSDDLKKAMYSSVDFPQVGAVKRNDALTVKARRARKIIADFDARADMKALSFRIIDPKGNTLSERDGIMAYRVVSNVGSYVASSSNDNRANDNAKYAKHQLTFQATKTLMPGIYKIEILNEKLYVGSLQVKLM